MQMHGYSVLRWTLAIAACALVITSQITSVTCTPDAQAMLSALEPPRRPEQFRSIDELNNYLAELRQYYTILGRPRFGRSVDKLLMRHAQRLAAGAAVAPEEEH